MFRILVLCQIILKPDVTNVAEWEILDIKIRISGFRTGIKKKVSKESLTFCEKNLYCINVIFDIFWNFKYLVQFPYKVANQAT